MLNFGLKAVYSLTMTPLSNLHGRVLEYLMAEEIIREYPKAVLTARANDNQTRDASKLKEVDSLILQDLKLATNRLLFDWLEPKFQLSDQETITIDRLPDQNKTDVTDIRLKSPAWVVNLSIKHNHKAIRHQRPGTTPKHCGYDKNSVQMKEFKKQYQKITYQFMNSVGQAKKFADLEADLIEEKLYIPVCGLVSHFINENANSCTINLFKYLFGTESYYKVIVYSKEKRLSIQEFNLNTIQVPNMVVVTVNKQYVNLDFNNNWQVVMRLHTASSKIGKSPSLKFDSQAKQTFLKVIDIIYD